tara:strand:+ start:1358 stop:1576 length:219 start_codon:yes stop_codon:yes gene_type:complete
MQNLKEKIAALQESNQQRVEQVKQHQTQIEQSQAAITGLKEQHDHARGKIDMLSELLAEQEQEKLNVKNDKK